MPAAAAFQAGLCPTARLGLALRPAFVLLGFRGPSIRKACVLPPARPSLAPAGTVRNGRNVRPKTKPDPSHKRFVQQAIGFVKDFAGFAGLRGV